ncbi:SGNH hydrolase domain-containing protein, partial [Roseovarius sp. S1116L3]|uniref:SGNH hydrolase domain-containing protein n=1 Tax=Roseovarius roseus TaxID=3342636 RepID=UPI003B66F39B
PPVGWVQVHPEITPPSNFHHLRDTTNALARIQSTAETLRALGKRVVIVSPPPNSGEDLGKCLLYARVWGKELSQCDFSSSSYSSMIEKSYRLLQKVEASIPVVFLDEAMCQDGTCATSDGNLFLYRDNGHLSIESARSLGSRIDLLALSVAEAK